MNKRLVLFIVGIVFFFIYDGYPQSNKKKFGIDKLTGSGINTEEIVEKLVEAESQKGEKYLKEISNQTIRNAIINFVELNLKELRDIAKSLYDYRSPFQNRVGYSSDDSVVQVLPNRGAEIGDLRIRVERMAKADVFISDPLPLDTELKPFKIKIVLLDKEVDIDFGGGKLRDLARVINEKASQIVSASVVRVDANNEVLRIEGKKTGKNAKVIIDGDLSELVRIGLLTKEKVVTSPPSELNILSQFTSLPSLTLKDKEELSRDIRYTISKNTILEVSNLFTQQPIPKPKELEIRVMESVKVSNVEVRGGTPITTFDILKEYTTNDFVFIVLHFVDGTKYQVTITPSETTKSINLSTLEGKEIERVVLRNNNDLSRMTFYRIVVRDRVEEVKRLSEYEPKNYVSKAENAVVYVNGVRIEREENDVKDIINGTLRVVGENPNKEVTTKVDYDYKAITNSISNLIEKYNDVMIYLSKITKPIVDRRQLYEKPDEEKEEGSFATDMEFIRLKDRLRMFAMQPYQTRQTNIRLLYHIGIYTKNLSTKLDFESDLWEYVRKGVLTIDNDKLVSVVIENIMAVNDIFGYDMNGDKVVDAGFAYNITVVCDEYTRAGGVIANKKRQIDNIIRSNKDLYAKFQDRLEDYRVSLERKFGKLQQVLRESKTKQDWFNAQVKTLGGENNK